MDPNSNTGGLDDSANALPTSINTTNSLQSPQISTITEPSNIDHSSSSSNAAAVSTGIPKTPERRQLDTDNIRDGEDGYDSDGQPAPWVSIQEDVEGFEVAEEEVLPEGEDDIDDSDGVESTPNPTNMSNENEVSMISMEALMAMKVLELREELKKRGLNVHGKKEELRNRLKDGIERNLPIRSARDMAVTSGNEEMAGGVFDPTAKWLLLKPDEEDVVNEDGLRDVDGGEYRAPTEPENERRNEYEKKRNYSHQFDRGVFTGTATVPQTRGRWKQLRFDEEGSVEYERMKQPIEDTTPNIEWCEGKGLGLDSHPVEWFNAFLPVKNKRHGGAGMSSFTMEKCLSWTNTKARMMNAGLGGKYSDFVDFSLVELMRHVGLYLFHGLSPSPQVEMKFKTQFEDPVNGNDFVHRAFGGQSGKSTRRHRHFKCFFACVDPSYPTPPRDTHPNWKVHPFLKHMLEVSKKGMIMGRNLSVDEQTIGFQGRHKDKQRITYKKEGDGFLADTICGDGYTYAFYFRHQPVSQNSNTNVFSKYSLSPLHMRVLSLISQLPHKHYTIGMDNLYMSAKFCRAAYELDQKAMLHGVTRPTLRGVPSCVKQKEVTRKADLEKVRHTVKVARLKGDSVCKDLVCISIYDSKPVYILTNVCNEVKWVEKKKKVWDDVKKEHVWITFHRLNVIDFYNFNMGNVDIADQLRNVYRYDSQWHRNRKWWWSLWWWGYQVLLTNAYVLYVKYHRMHRSKGFVSHYDFIQKIALAWIAPDLHWPGWNKKRKAVTQIHQDEEVTVSICTSTTASATNTRRRRLLQDNENSSYCSSGGGSSSSSAVCEATIVSSRGPVARRMTDKSLCPMAGSMKIRLNKMMGHHPISSKGRAKCQLHRWARGRSGKEVRGRKVMKCSTCDVQLCDKCWVAFHDTVNLLPEKAKIAKT